MKITAAGQEIMEALGFPMEAAKLPESDVPGWTHDKIRKEFDRNPNLTVKDLARKTGLSTAEVKKILREGANKWASRRAIMEITAEGQQIREALGFQKDAGKFDLGRMVQTRGVAHKARENREFGREIKDALRKYVRGDWGISKDKRMNDQAVKNGDDRIMGVYPTDEGDIWIITEWDRSVTTILFPSEY
jgi:hypothetical protein